MASALTISLGLTTIVAGEIRSAGPTPPAERAYYKAESYVEQALYNRKKNPNYNVADANQEDWKNIAGPEGNGYVCTTAAAADACFSREPENTPT
ncbi:MAG: hypothetical protein WKG07_23875 [Hymenobacter sp.]